MSLENFFRVPEWPRLIHVKQHFSAPEVEDFGEKIREGFDGLKNIPDIKGKRIGIAVGSRGINAIDVIVLEVIKNLKRLGANPFIFPAMGSHGGAVAEGQTQMIEGLGISEERMGVPVISDMDVECITTLRENMPVYVSKTALEADGVIIVNRIKMHTSFRGRYESGILKMLVVGVGKHQGALTFHSLGFENMAQNLIDMAAPILGRLKIVCAVGLVENAFEKTAEIAVLDADQIMQEEPKLLSLSKSLMPRIPFNELDILVLKRIGKDISGDGMDPNITGRYTPDIKPDYTMIPRIKRIVAFDLTDASHGIATGMGHLDAATQRFRDKIDFDATYMNCITATVTNTCRVPIIMPDERSALDIAYRTTQLHSIDDLKICILEDTLHLEEMVVSEALYHKECKHCRVEYIGDFFDLTFDQDNGLMC